MSDSRNNGDKPGEPLSYWQDCLRQFASAANRQGDAAVDLDDVLWRQPLLLWERAATSMMAAKSPAPKGAGAREEALKAYRQTLLEYTGALRDVSAQALSDVAQRWDRQRSAGQPTSALRELFDLYVDLGERRYHELVSSERFAEISGRMINHLVACAGDGTTRAGTESAARPTGASGAQSEYARTTDVPEFLTGLGFGVEQTLAELQAFGEKLDIGVTTLREIGAIEVGTSEKEAIHHDGKFTLYRYLPDGEIRNPIPVLIVYALANRPYMMDLQPQRSPIRGLMDKGLEIYLIDWGYPDADDTELGLDDYIDGYIGDCVDTIRDRHGLDGINLLGVCQGGTFSLCYSALYSDKIRNLVLMVTPVDFHTPDNLLTTWLRHVDVDRLVDVLGNVPGELLNWVFVSMKPLRLTGQKYLDMLNLLDDEEKTKTFLRMEKWIHDSPAQAGECFRQFAKDFYQQNKLINGGIEIGDRAVELQRITMPVLNVYATRDHIVPPDASRALEAHIASTDYTSFAFEGGHIGIYVSARAQRQVPHKIAEWLQTRCETQT